MGLHFILQHLDRPGTYVRILFVEFSSAFNTIIPDTLQNTSHHPHLHLSVDHQLPDRQATDSEARKILIQNPYDQHWSSSGLCFLPTALLSLHERLHIQRPLCQAPEFCRWHHTDRPSSKTVTGLLTDRRLRSWLSGAVTTTWSLTCSKLWRCSWTSGETPLLSHHSPSWTAPWLQWSHSDSWAPQFIRTWSETITLSPLWKRTSRGCTSFAIWGSSTCHRSCWNSSTLPSLSSAHQ